MSWVSSHFIGCNFILPEEIPTLPHTLDQSINQCQVSSTGFILWLLFQFSQFKMGKPTPLGKNDSQDTEFVTELTRQPSFTESSPIPHSVGLADDVETDLQCPSPDPYSAELWNPIEKEEELL
jgi:hypothetical protein